MYNWLYFDGYGSIRGIGFIVADGRISSIRELVILGKGLPRLALVDSDQWD